MPCNILCFFCRKEKYFNMSKIVRIGDKYYDFETKNVSFLLTAKELKTLGIKNWYICLEVKYPQLGVQDLDPWSDKLTPEEIGKILIEAKDNIWYFLREIATIPAKGAPSPFSPYLTRASHAAIWCFAHNIDFRLTQPRQTHKTTFVTLLIEHAFLFDLHNVNIPYVHIRDGRAQDNAGVLRDYITEGLPKYMNPWIHDKRLPGLKSVRYDQHKTQIKIISSADSPEKAMDKLRGETLYVGFLDEWEYVTYMDSMLAGAAPAFRSARNIAKQTGQRTCIMYASTPGNLDTPEGKVAQRIIDNTPPFSEKFYDLTEQEIENMMSAQVDPNDPDKKQVTAVYIEYDWKQLRKTEEWVREQYNDAIDKGKIDEYRRGVLLQRYRGSAKVLFRQEDIEYIQNNQKKPDYEVIILKKYVMFVYKHEIKFPDLTSDTPYFDTTIPYLVGIDCATGSGGDNTAFVIVHPYTLEVVAELKSPFMSPLDCMRVITQLALLLPKCIFCLESNHIGKSIVAYAEESPLINRFYHDPRLDISKNATMLDFKKMSLQERSQNRQYIGTAVTPTVRDNMIELLKRFVRDYRHLLLSKYLVDDITKLTILKNGKVAAESGEHDDIVFAYLHTIYVLTYGYALNRFGIDKSLCTYEKAYVVLDSYEKQLSDKIVDNLVPYDCPTIYEGQVLKDMTNNKTMSFNEDGVDEYGYSHEQYKYCSGMQKSDDTGLPDSLLSFFRDVNSF